MALDYRAPRRGWRRLGGGGDGAELLVLGRMGWVPTVIENEGGNRERSFDIYSRLLRDRIVIVGRPIDDVVANLVVAQLIFLAAEDPDKEIQMYINSPGGAVAPGFAIYDTMQYVSPPVSTIAIGRAASFGTVLLMGGTKGRRFALPNARIHLHQPLIAGRGLQGQATDLDIHAREILRIKDELNRLIARHTGQPLERVERDTDRDFFLSPEESIEYGLIDGVIEVAPAVAAAVAASGGDRPQPGDGSAAAGTRP
jgi:ATP-dependent Clp protease protease subunit